MTAIPGATANSWSFTHNDSADASQAFHQWTLITDAGTQTSKQYYAGALASPAPPLVVPIYYLEFSAAGSPLQQLNYGYAQDAAGNVYLNQQVTILDGSMPYTQYFVSTYGRDSYGNITQADISDFPDHTTWKWVYNSSYLADPNYTSRYLRNRLTQSTVTVSGTTTTLVSNTYDACCLTDNPNLSYHDSSYSTSFTYRGNLTSSSPDNHTYGYDIGGNRLSSTDGAGRSVGISTDSSTAYSLPSVLTPGGNSNLSTSISYASSWAVTSVVEPNGATSSTTYDQWGRPQTSTLADGAVTNYTYTYNPNTQTATISNPPENPSGTKWKRTTLDGFGRVTRVETGHDGTTVSTVDTQYAPCACSPLGKMYRVSQPYAPGATPAWTTYTYDGRGRTLTVTAADGSVTRTSYQGNQTTVTDPAGKWKTSVTDAQGNLVQVIEPNPAGGANFVTSYTYDGMNHLTGVTLTRPEGTQTRTFVYTGPDLTSASNPENGPVRYTYNGAHQVATRTDANGNVTQYNYDGYGRLSQVLHNGNTDWTYTYDSPIDSSFGATNTWGRLTAVQFGAQSGQSVFNPGFAYEYGYNAAGRVTMQRMAAIGLYSSTMTFDATYAWDNEGRMSSRTYPSGWWSPGSGTTYSLQYDLMGRLNGITHGGVTDASATYGPANEMTNLSYEGYSETRTYNSLLQLTRQTVAGVFDMEYVFPAGANDGRVSSTIDHISGEQENYTYDALNRLTLAQTVSSAWGQAYTFDGFGNLTAKTVTQGSGSNWAQAYDPATNRAVANSGMTYDANGNTQYTYYGPIGYDAENRITSEGNCPNCTSLYYDPSGKRVAVVQPNANTWTLYFYDITGQRIMSLPYPSGQQTYSLYFGGKLVVSDGVTVVTDRLGSVRANGNGETFSYLPYGEERTATADGRVKFGTYFRDSSGVAAQDYADQRYYNPWYGRFNTPDPSLDGVDRGEPETWNAYTYSNNDPINFNDPSGLDVNLPTGPGGDPNSCLNQQLIPFMRAKGYSYQPFDDLGNFLNTSTGVLGLTLYFESAAGSKILYIDMAQVMLNIYQLQTSDPNLRQRLHLPTGSFVDVVRAASNVWNGGTDLTDQQYNNLTHVLNGSVVGPSSQVNASACDHLISAFNISDTAQHYIDGSRGLLASATVTGRTYWFFGAGTGDPVSHRFWTTTVSDPIDGFVFETLVEGPRPRRPRF